MDILLIVIIAAIVIGVEFIVITLSKAYKDNNTNLYFITYIATHRIDNSYTVANHAMVWCKLRTLKDVEDMTINIPVKEGYHNICIINIQKLPL